MSILDWMDARIFFILSFIMPFIIWMYFGLQGKFYPWHDNVFIEKNTASYIITGNKWKSTQKMNSWEKEKNRWLITGILGMALLAFVLSVTAMR